MVDSKEGATVSRSIAKAHFPPQLRLEANTSKNKRYSRDNLHNGLGAPPVVWRRRRLPLAEAALLACIVAFMVPLIDQLNGMGCKGKLTEVGSVDVSKTS